MNVTPSKVLLGLSLAAYTWLSWDHLGTSSPVAEAAQKTKELTAAMVNRPVKLALADDPFHSAPLTGASGITGETGVVATPGAAGAAGDPEKVNPLSRMVLQGVLLVPPQRAAIIDGRVMYEGGLTTADSGAPICVRKVGLDYAVVEGPAGMITLKLEEKSDQNRAQTASRSESPGRNESPAAASSGTGGGLGHAKSSAAPATGGGLGSPRAGAPRSRETR